MTDTPYTARFELPDLIERGRPQTLRCRVYRDGVGVAASAATVTVYSADDAAVVSAASATVGGADTATYDLAGSATTGLDLGDRWRVEWAVTIGGSVYTFRNDAALVRHRLYPVVTDADLFRRMPKLDPDRADAISIEADYQSFLDEAWTEIQHHLIAAGNRPWLVMSPSALREPHMLLTLSYIMEDLATSLSEVYSDAATEYRRQYDRAVARISLEYDHDQDGEIDEAPRRAVRGSLWLGSC